MKKNITLRHFTIFICVCEENNMTHAARRLHMTQPSVSQVIQEIEGLYGTRLFERLGRSLHITSAGKRLLQYAYQIVSLTNQIEATMTSFQTTIPLRIGASVSIGEFCLIEYLHFLHTYRKQAPIFSEIHNTTELESMLLCDKLDFALLEGAIRSEYIITLPFMEDELIIAVPPQHPLVKKGRIQLSDLRNFPMFLREEGSGTRNLFTHIMEEHHIPFQICGVYNNTESLKKAVLAGLGGTVLSRHLVRKEWENGELGILYIENDLFHRHFKIAYHKDKFLFPALQDALTICRDYTRWFPGTFFTARS